MAAILAIGSPNDGAVSELTEAPSWSVSRISAGEAEDIAAYYSGFESESRPVAFWRERLRLWWQGNPAFSADWHAGVKMTVGNRIVGVLCALPVRVLHEGRPMIAAALTSWRVDKEYRAGSIAMFEAAVAAHAVRPIFDTTPTPGVIRLLNHYGFHRPRESFAATKLLANPLRLAARLFKVKPARLTKSHYFVNDRPSSPDATSTLVDNLWNRVVPSVGTLGIKDGAYFRWYCQEGRTNGRFGLVTTDASGVPSGMAVVMDMGNGVAWIVDLWCDFTDISATRNLISHARRHASKLGFHCLWVSHFNEAVASACGMGPTQALPVSAFFKVPGTMPAPEASFWTIAVGDFGA